MKVLVTGGAGFIGSHLCEKLLYGGYKIICLDNLLTGQKKNISHLSANPHFKFIKQDISTLTTNYQLPATSYIFHLASPASPVDYQKYPLETMIVNSIGTLNMLELAKKNKAKFLLTSTSEVYGDPKEHPQKESYWGNVNPLGLRSCYDEAKRFAEALTMVYIRKKNLDARIIRIFNTYGPRMRQNDGRVVSNFINQALSNKFITVYGNGRQTRSFCYVSDMVDGLIKAMFMDKTKGEVFNLGNPDERQVLEIAKLIKKMTGSKSKIIFTNCPEDDPFRRCPNISKAKKILSWQPKISLSQGFQKTIDYFKK